MSFTMTKSQRHCIIFPIWNTTRPTKKLQASSGMFRCPQMRCDINKSQEIQEISWEQRTQLGETFIRNNVINESEEIGESVVLSTPHAESKPWEGKLLPGKYHLSDLVNFPDLSHPKPRYAKFRIDPKSWKSSTERSKSGILELSHADLKENVIPVEIATDILLDFYGCHLIGYNTGGEIQLTDEHVIQDFTYRDDYFAEYVAGVGAGLETHDFAHIDCPLDPIHKNGFFLLGKKEMVENNEMNLHLTAFRIPQLHSLYVPGGTIHSNDYLKGTWRTMLSWTSEEPIDHVVIKSGKTNSKKKAMLKIEGVDIVGDKMKTKNSLFQCLIP